MRTLDSELADSGYAPTFIDAFASARRADRNSPLPVKTSTGTRW
jgi:hypothetical protein